MVSNNTMFVKKRFLRYYKRYSERIKTRFLSVNQNRK